MKLNFIVARYKENIGWLKQLPSESKIYLYNKGPEISENNKLDNMVIKNLPNTGRESGTYLYYMMNDHNSIESDYTIFTQGDPFEHSPNFLDLIEENEKWKNIQPLSLRWIEEKNIPPIKILEDEKSDWIDNIAIRQEFFSLKTWAPLGFFDEGAWLIGRRYLEKHMLPDGANIAEHFLEMVGMEKLALEASKHQYGVFSYGAIFAVKTNILEKFINNTSSKTMDRLALLSRADMNYGYIFERLWLHFFGEPFLSFKNTVK